MNKKLVTVLTSVFCFSLMSVTAFADTTTQSSLGKYTVKGELNVSNPIYANPSAYAKTWVHEGVSLYSLEAKVTVVNSDKTSVSKSKSGESTDKVQTDSQYANTFSSSDVKFYGSHKVQDKNVGTWQDGTDYKF
ncbi:hypothetical protein [Paenibacillus sp. NAIST15-1]|uniref:hypothetical protein n=1 Tax=Paenibacillus sp. NAIST15-1 TaxID=1605994 RepID=UPI00086CDD04|nr:hypothetical protein [Paenibacillus sp. NAIST15-1]GAV10267.1 hypothetical protein PBN151_0172 [Paenibacillus sp. NAIST15-1]